MQGSVPRDLWEGEQRGQERFQQETQVDQVDQKYKKAASKLDQMAAINLLGLLDTHEQLWIDQSSFYSTRVAFHKPEKS